MSSQAFRIPKDGDFPTSLGHLCHCLATMECGQFQNGIFYLCSPGLFETIEKSLASSSSLSPISCSLIRFPLSLLLSRLSSPSFLSLLPVCVRCSSAFLPSAGLWKALSMKSRSPLLPQPSWEHWWEGRQPCAVRTLCWLLLSLGSNRSPKAFLQSCFPASWPPACPASGAQACLSLCWPSWDSSWPVAPSERQLIHLVAQPHLPVCPLCALAQGALFLHPGH